MSVKHYNERRKLYRKTQGPVSNPGQPSPVNRKARRAYHNAPTVVGLKPFDATEFYHQQMNEMLDDPNPPESL